MRFTLKRLLILTVLFGYFLGMLHINGQMPGIHNIPGIFTYETTLN